jgi:hypothetical protein
MNLKKGYIWNKIFIKLFPEGIKSDWMPFYWGYDINIGIGMTFPFKKGFHLIPKVDLPHGKWTYKWELQRHDGHDKEIINRGEGDLNFNTLSDKLTSVIKKDAIVIKDLDEGTYKLLISFENSEGEKVENLPYPFIVRNEVDYKSTNLLPIILSISALIVSIISLIISFKR